MDIFAAHLEIAVLPAMLYLGSAPKAKKKFEGVNLQSRCVAVGLNQKHCAYAGLGPG